MLEAKIREFISDITVPVLKVLRAAAHRLDREVSHSRVSVDMMSESLETGIISFLKDSNTNLGPFEFKQRVMLEAIPILLKEGTDRNRIPRVSRRLAEDAWEAWVLFDEDEEEP